MTSSFDPSTDLADVIDGLETITLRRRGRSDDTAIAHALRRELRTQEVEASDGKYIVGDVRWHLPIQECAASPKLGDAIIDNQGQRYTVLAVQQATQSTRWACWCRNVAIVHGLDAFVDIEQAVYSKGTGGAAEATWHTWKTGVQARIQPLSSNEHQKHQRQEMTKQFVVMLAEEVELDHRHRIKGPDGSIYRIDRVKKAEQLDTLLTLEVTKTA